jgi:hypothetical protein
MDDKLRLDGNAAAGTLGEVFSFEVTTAYYACERCGRANQIGAAMAYEVRGWAPSSAAQAATMPSSGSLTTASGTGSI